MSTQVIHIFGASGSGTTTLGRLLSEKTGFYHMDTDDYYWLPTETRFTVKRAPADRVALMKEDIQRHKNVIISGSLCGWGDELMSLFTLAIRLNTDTAVRIRRLKEREKTRFGGRIEWGGDMYNQHMEFVEWAARYDGGDVTMRSKAAHDRWQKRLDCPLVTLNGEAAPEESYELLRNYGVLN